MKKIALALSVVLMAGIVLSACGTDNTSSMSENSSTTFPSTAISAPQTSI